MKKVVLIGTGMVGSSYIFSLVTQKIANEIVLIDRTKELAKAHLLDLDDSKFMLNSDVKIKTGDYTDCKDADIVCITAGLSKIKDSRIELLEGNNKIISDIVNQVLENDFKGIFLLATNPVDLMAQKTLEISKFKKSKVLSSGTNLDTSRLKVELAKHFKVSNNKIQTYIIGEHGQTALPVWSKTKINKQNILELEEEKTLNDIFEKSKNRAMEILKGKGATYFGIGTSLAQITNAILNDTKEEILVGVNYKDTYVSLPSIIGKDGIEKINKLELNKKEEEKFNNSINTLKKLYTLIK